MPRPFSESTGQEWPQILQLILAIGLSSLIGAERQMRHKSAGLRTNTLVGLGSALFMLMSKYGFSDILTQYKIVLDPSRIAAQIVSGIGFIGGGIIFKQQNEVRGLTTAAAVWLTSAVGAACGAGLPILAAITTGLYFITVLVYPFLWHFVEHRVHRSNGMDAAITIRYRDISGGLQSILERILKAGFTVRHLGSLEEVLLERSHSHISGASHLSPIPQSAPGSTVLPSPAINPHSDIGEYVRIFDVKLIVEGERPASELVCMLSELHLVVSVTVAGDPTDEV